MYNKISSIILNSSKSSGFSNVFIAQPDSLKEGLAGKAFVIAEIGAKKTDAKKIFDFLIRSLDENYYEDEKILLRDKIEGLKVENIFEAAISKTNKGLSDFLSTEKIKVNPAMTNISLGVIYENKLYFSTYGRNRAFLVYKHKDQFEIINVEANASEVDSGRKDLSASGASLFFSSVISGEIPVASYFIFTSEALPEYISNKDLISIITKLPPIVAAEQIKNVLGKINSFVPFLGIIIKNTTGLDKQELYDEVEENLNAHGSISSLNYTEEKTERMLEPAGLINFSKIYKNLQRRLKKKLKPESKISNKIYKSNQEEIDTPVSSAIEVGKVNSLKSIRSDSFLVKEKMFFKKRPNFFNFNLKKVFSSFIKIFNVSYLKAVFINLKRRFFSLEKRNRLLLSGLAAGLLILIISISLTGWLKKQEALRAEYNNLVSAIEEKKEKIESSLLYENEEGAKTNLEEAKDLLSYLPRDKKNQEELYKELAESLNNQEDKIRKIIKIDNLEKVNDLSGLSVDSLVLAKGNLYAASENKIYKIKPQSSEVEIIDVLEASNLTKSYFDGQNTIYYFDLGKLFKFNISNSQVSSVAINSEIQSEALSYKIYSNNLYILTNQEIFKSLLSGGSYTTKNKWLKSEVDLSLASDFYIPNDGNIYVLNNDGQIIKLRSGNKINDYKSAVIEPTIQNDNRLIISDNNVYSLDSLAKRLLVRDLEKGSLLSQYQLDSLSSLQDFAIDEESRVAYILDGEAVYKINLQ